MAGENTHLESDGQSVYVTLSADVDAKQVAYIDGWLGITAQAGESGDIIALIVDRREYQFTVPSTLSVSKGATVYVDVTDLTGHTPSDSAYATTGGANMQALCKATAAKDANHVVTGIMVVV